MLYPPVLREILIRAAAAGLFTPLWSDRILEEWARATRKLGGMAEAEARGAIALLGAAFPQAMVRAQPGLEARLHLPDENDIHVLAVAIAGSADAILTFNSADFPRHVLAAEGVARREPDGFLWELYSHHPGPMGEVLSQVRAEAERMAGVPVSLKALLKRSKLSRLAKAAAAGTE